MRRTNAVGSNLLGGQKAIGGLGGSPRAAGVRNAGGRVGELVGDDADKTLGEAGIAEVGSRQFLSSPASGDLGVMYSSRQRITSC